MEWSIMLFVNSILLGIGLAMDAFSVSMANGLKEPEMSGTKMSGVAGMYAFFQFAMPMIGWVCVHTIATYFKGFTYAIPWIALVLLLYIGGKMLIEGIKYKDDENVEHSKLTFVALLVQGIATSIDALSVGFTISEYSWLQALVSALIIGVMTFGISFGGILIGKKVGTKLSNKADILGGIILIGIGIEIFVSGMISLYA